MRVVIADDSGIFRRGLRLLLEAAGIEVVEDVDDVPRLIDAVEERRPDVCIIDIRMPPTFTDEGLRAAEEIHRRLPTVGLLLLSTYADTTWAQRLLQSTSGGAGYLLKDRVDDVHQLVEAIHRVGDGRTAVDPEIVTLLVRRNQAVGHLDSLTRRERSVLEMMAQGLSNAGIGRALFLSEKTVEAHAKAVFSKLQLRSENGARDQNRRVLAVLAYLEHSS
jgi:DNA-binding NarL/FixJ family response regulator